MLSTQGNKSRLPCVAPPRPQEVFFLGGGGVSIYTLIPFRATLVAPVAPGFLSLISIDGA